MLTADRTVLFCDNRITDCWHWRSLKLEYYELDNLENLDIVVAGGPDTIITQYSVYLDLEISPSYPNTFTTSLLWSKSKTLKTKKTFTRIL